ANTVIQEHRCLMLFTHLLGRPLPARITLARPHKRVSIGVFMMASLFSRYTAPCSRRSLLLRMIFRHASFTVLLRMFFIIRFGLASATTILPLFHPFKSFSTDRTSLLF